MAKQYHAQSRTGSQQSYKHQPEAASTRLNCRFLELFLEAKMGSGQMGI